MAENPLDPQDRASTAAADLTVTAPDDPPLYEPWVAPASLPSLPDDPPGSEPARRRPDVLMLVVGLLALAMSVAAFVGVVPDLSGFDPRWLLAGGAAAVGALLLLSGLRHRAHPH